MTGIYLTWLVDELAGAGLAVVAYAGWETRARSSGGYAAPPLAVMWHHTASQTSPANDAAYMCDGSDDRPIANLLVARDGQVWVLAAGATNTNGKGGPLSFSAGTVPVDGMNTRAVGVELANAGTGVESYPQAQIDAMFAVSNVINARLGNVPGDLAGHWDWSPGRKIDPAPAASVAGPWSPGAVTSSGTWAVADVIAEAQRRAAPPVPDPAPSPDLERIDDMLHVTAPNRGATLLGPQFRHYAHTPDETVVFQRAYGDPVELSDYDYDILCDAVFVLDLPKSQGGPF